MTSGAIAGIIVSIALLIIITTLIFLYLNNNKKKNNTLNKDELLKKQKKIQEAKTQEIKEEKINANVEDIDKTLKTIKKMDKKLPNGEIEKQDMVIMRDEEIIKKNAIKSKKPIKNQNITNYYNNHKETPTPLIGKKSFLTGDHITNRITNIAYLDIIDNWNEDNKTERQDYIPEKHPKKYGYGTTIFNDEDLVLKQPEQTRLDNFKTNVDNFFNGIHNGIDTIKINIDCVGIRGEKKNTLKSLTKEQITYLLKKAQQSGKKINISNRSHYGATFCKSTNGPGGIDLIELLQNEATQPIIYTSINDRTKKYTKKEVYTTDAGGLPIKFRYNVWNDDKITLLFEKKQKPKVINNRIKKQLLGNKQAVKMI